MARVDYANSSSLVMSPKIANEIAAVLALMKPLYIAVGA